MVAHYLTRKQKAWFSGIGVFVGVYAGLLLLKPLVPEGTWIALIALFIGARVIDVIDPIAQ